MGRTGALLVLGWAPWWIGCGVSDRANPFDAGSIADAEIEDVAPARDAALPPIDGGRVHDAGMACGPQLSDYTPRIMMSATDTWPACNADDGIYDRAGTAPLLFDEMYAFDTVFTPPRLPEPFSIFGYGVFSDVVQDPSRNEFSGARQALLLRGGNLGPGLHAIHDVHASRPEATCTSSPESPCRCLDIAARNPLYCVGPTWLEPLFNDNLRRGIDGDTADPSRLYGARIEAALTWFFYLSALKESESCATNANGCDVALSSYASSMSRESTRGLGRLIRPLDPETHARILDGLFAVRCWRDLDRATPAAMLMLQSRARGQLERAFTRGIALIILGRLGQFSVTTGLPKQAHHAYLKVLLAPIPATMFEETGDGPSMIHHLPARHSLFDSVLRAVSPADADFVEAEIARPIDRVNAGEIAVRINAAIPCD